MGWRPAYSLMTLKRQIDQAYPTRSTASDGIIGDAAHQATVSDHNPDEYGIVRAIDITHDPIHGVDIDQLTDKLVASRDGRIKYLIANRLITGPEWNWQWENYFGDDPHTGHMHLSVVPDSRADSIADWKIGGQGMELSDIINVPNYTGDPRRPAGKEAMTVDTALTVLVHYSYLAWCDAEDLRKQVTKLRTEVDLLVQRPQIVIQVTPEQAAQLAESASAAKTV